MATADKQWYIDYFNRMEEEDKKCMLGGMAWDGLSYYADKAIENNLFTIKELKERWPYLWGWLKDDN